MQKTKKVRSYLFIIIIRSVKVCFGTKWTVVQAKCENSCSRYYQLKCKLAELCTECVNERRQKLYAKIRYKFENSNSNSLVLWTLGTNWRGNDNYKLLQRCWSKFRKSMYHVNGFKPVFRVTEQGSKGGYLHIHFLNTDFLRHSIALRQWSRITKIRDPNVNFSDKEGSVDKAINYLMKYMSKGSKTTVKNRESVDILRKTIKYSWLGEWYKIKFEKLDAPLCKDGYTYSYYNSVNEWDGLRSKSLYNSPIRSSFIERKS